MLRSLAINEIFCSIQGESTHVGRPCVFVRLMGCPLRCKYCDTEYAFFEGKKKTFEEIFGEVDQFGVKLLEVTGGEPLAQPNAIPFMKEVLERGYEVLFETRTIVAMNGSERLTERPLSNLHRRFAPSDSADVDRHRPRDQAPGPGTASGGTGLRQPPHAGSPIWGPGLARHAVATEAADG